MLPHRRRLAATAARPALVATLATAAALAAGAPVAAADEPTPPAPCWAPFSGAQNPLQSDFMRLRLGERPPAVIGPDQLGEIALGPAAGTWTVRVAPGPLDLAAARAALEAHLRSVLAPADADLAIAALRVEATPYPYAEMVALSRTIAQQLIPAGVQAWAVGPSCRVTVQLFRPNGLAELAAVRALTAPHGDKVWVELVDSDAPVPMADGGASTAREPRPAPGDAPGGTPKPATPAPRTPAQGALTFAAVVRAPAAKRCVAGATVTLRPRDGAKLAVTTRGRTVRSRGTKGVRVTLRGRTTTVTVKATARDGRTVTRRLTYRRCAAKG